MCGDIYLFPLLSLSLSARFHAIRFSLPAVIDGRARKNERKRSILNTLSTLDDDDVAFSPLSLSLSLSPDSDSIVPFGAITTTQRIVNKIIVNSYFVQ